MIENTTTSRYFATVHEGKILGLCEAIPPHELSENQIMLSKDEFLLLSAVGDVRKAYKLIKAVLAKIKANNDG